MAAEASLPPLYACRECEPGLASAHLGEINADRWRVRVTYMPR